MNNQFIYSILKYQHSQLLGESINLGVLFSFDEGKKVHFTAGNPQRVKSVYPSFDSAIFQTIVKGIKQKLIQEPHAEGFFPKNYSFTELIQLYLIPEDSSSFQFSEPFAAINSSGQPERAIEEFSRILLPEVEVKKEENRHNEGFLLKKYADYMAGRNINVDYKMRKNQLIQIKGLKMNFEFSWKNGIVHLIKPISFDLRQESDIQNKSAQFFGYLDLLTEYAKRNDYTFDLLIGKPQDEKLYNSYEDALYILNCAGAPKDIITEEKLADYSEKTAEILHGKEEQN
ncbi:MAG TPA: hypothetical protein VNU72_08320 [Puia sp.]|jgi:hypothetical protein|nr:hypothetical protein [Puia sp.]